MTIDKKDLEKVARQAALKLSDERIEQLVPELNSILKMIEVMSELDTSDVVPSSNSSGAALPLRNDVVSDGGIREQILANAPEQTQGYFVVQKIVE